MSLLEVKNLSVAWEGQVAVKNVSFSLAGGQVLAIVGESGSGKSTLLKAIMGLPSDERSIASGTITFAGQELTTLDAAARRALCGPQISMIFQDAGASFCPVRRVGAELWESVHLHKDWTRQEARERALALMARLHLDASVLEAYPFELSGGMGQRVGILAALLMQPQLLLADEPTSALDTVPQVAVVKELQVLCREPGTAARWRQVQVIFQQPEASFDPRRTLGWRCAEPLRTLGAARAAREQRVRELLARVELPESIAARYPFEVSGGQCQRAAIARALTTQPQLLICDEVTSALDVTLQQRIVALIRELCRERQLTCLFITHDLPLLAQVADRVCVMEQGRIVEQGATATVVAHPQSLAARRLLAVDFFRMVRS